MSLLPMKISPAVGITKPAIILNVVVLPQPDGPKIEKNSPELILKSMPLTATLSSNFLLVYLFEHQTYK